jgi:predicted aspartyl protease
MPRTKCGFVDNPTTGQKGCDALVTAGPSLLVDIGFDSGYAPSPGVIPKPAVTGVWALVDTGATASCIDSKLADDLHLPIIDRQKIAGIAGISEANIHLAQIHVPSLSYTIYGYFAAVNLTGGGQHHKALIGRTFLRSFTMIYSGQTGDVELFS